jgi:hypothetical protein
MHSHTIAITITITLAVGLAAVAPTSLLAQPAREAATPTHDLRALASTSSLAGTTETQNLQSPDVRDAAQTAQALQDLRPPDVRDVAAGRGTDNSPRVVIVKVPPSAAAPASAGGIDWADAGIGAGSLLGLSLLGLGGTFAIVHRRRAHETPPVARV